MKSIRDCVRNQIEYQLRLKMHKQSYEQVNNDVRNRVCVHVFEKVSEQLFGKIHIQPLKRNIWNQ
jgi:RNAse (barnase) inhibitor barstar